MKNINPKLQVFKAVRVHHGFKGNQNKDFYFTAYNVNHLTRWLFCKNRKVINKSAGPQISGYVEQKDQWFAFNVRSFNYPIYMRNKKFGKKNLPWR